MIKMRNILKKDNKSTSKDLIEEVKDKSNSLKGKIIKLYGLETFETINNEIEMNFAI